MAAAGPGRARRRCPARSTNGSGHASKRSTRAADLVAVLDVYPPVVGAPGSVRRHRGARTGSTERPLHPPRHGRKQQRRVVLARHEEDPVRPGSRERGQGFHRVRVRRQHALQPRQRFRLRAAERRVAGRAALPREPVELEGVAVQDEVCRAAALRVERLQKERELLAPAKVLLDTPRPRCVPAEAHVQVRDYGDQPRRTCFPCGGERRGSQAEYRGHERGGQCQLPTTHNSQRGHSFATCRLKL